MFRLKAPVLLLAVLVLLCAFAAAIYDHTYKQRAAANFRNLTSTEAEQLINTMIETDGAEAAWEFLKRTYIQDGTVRLGINDPHSLAHDVGVGFFREYGIGGIDKCDETFTGGCYHGVIEELVIEGKGDAKSVGELCIRQHDPESCAHGAGHGIHEYSSEALPATLAQCEQFPQSLTEHCAEGVLMDDAWGWNNAELEAHPWDACTKVADDYKVMCASAIGNYLSEHQDPGVPNVRKYSVSYVSEVCTQAPTAAMQDKCFLRLEQGIARRAAAGKSIEELCAVIAAERIGQCIAVATKFAHMPAQ